MENFPFYAQLDSMDCGPSCIKMIAKFYGKSYSINTLREASFISRRGITLLGASEAAESIAMRTLGVKIDFDTLEGKVKLPCIVHWKQNHFIVVYKVNKKNVFVADPAFGLLKYKKDEFLAGWISDSRRSLGIGIALLMEPTPLFYEKSDDKESKFSLLQLFKYVMPFKKHLIQLFLGIAFGSVVGLILPFITQSVVDRGINNRNIGIVQILLFAQFIMILSKNLVDFIRSWIILHIGTRVNIQLVSDYLTKMMKLPISYFETKKVGDILQRINDNKRIESFLTSSILSIVFSIINILIYGIVLLIYNIEIFGIYMVGGSAYVMWIFLFQKKRKEIDIRRFAFLSSSNNNMIQMISGMQEIKMNNCERKMRWDWEKIQAKLFNTGIKALAVSQYQQFGAILFVQIEMILIFYITAGAVINGRMSFGIMLAIHSIVGQLNSPLEQIISFIRSLQDANISYERLSEIQHKEDEVNADSILSENLTMNDSIKIENLDFQYEGPHSEHVLKDINLEIPGQKITAIVGMSGGGKTTLMKLLLGFYKPVSGKINIGDEQLNNININEWRKQCGAVLQDGYIFSDTIANNIAFSDEIKNPQRIIQASKIANIYGFIESLPLGFNTKIGSEGIGLSQGQKQRILLARAAYKNPKYLFLDEATNALDSNNERIIIDNLNEFFQGKTVVIIAHRLSTVKNADQIVVLDQGRIVETGNHVELIKNHKHYYNLVKNQLEYNN